MKISVIAPVKNEVDFIGFSAMSVLPYVHEILYGVAESDDGTEDLLRHIQAMHDPYGKIHIFTNKDFKIDDGSVEPGNWDFDPMDMKAYNESYNYLIRRSTGDAVWFLHPDMIVTNPEIIPTLKGDVLSWFTHVASFARDLKTEIVSGRTKRWKNIHANQFGLHYFGGYGSNNEDFYHKEITGTSYRHYGDDFVEYPFEVVDSGIKVNHYCELKSYERRLEKMKRCLKTQHPTMEDKAIDEAAKKHPRVTLDDSSDTFGRFKFEKSKQPVPTIFTLHAGEFAAFKKKRELVND